MKFGGVIPGSKAGDAINSGRYGSGGTDARSQWRGMSPGASMHRPSAHGAARLVDGRLRPRGLEDHSRRQLLANAVIRRLAALSIAVRPCGSCSRLPGCLWLRFCVGSADFLLAAIFAAASAAAIVAARRRSRRKIIGAVAGRAPTQTRSSTVLCQFSAAPRKLTRPDGEIRAGRFDRCRGSGGRERGSGAVMPGR
jgi:hypothetical protein